MFNRTDENRALSHVAVLPSLLSVLSNVLGLNKVQVGVTEPLSMDDLTLVRASVGALLNMSLKYGKLETNKYQLFVCCFFSSILFRNANYLKLRSPRSCKRRFDETYYIINTTSFNR